MIEVNVRGAWVTFLGGSPRGLLGVSGIVVRESGLEVGEGAERFNGEYGC